MPFFSGVNMKNILYFLILTGCSSIHEQKNLSRSLEYNFPPKPLKVMIKKKVDEYKRGYVPNILIENDKFYLLDSQKRIICYDLSSGQKLWTYQFNITKEENTFHAINNGILYCISSNGKIIAFCLKNKKVIWEKNLHQTLLPTLALKNDILLITDGKELIALNKKNGEEEWIKKRNFVFNNILMNNDIVLDQENIYLASSHLECFYRQNGQEIWNVNIADQLAPFIQTTPIVDHDAVFTVSYKGNLIKVNKEDGKLIWKKDTKITTPLCMHNHYLYFIDDHKHLCCFNKNTGDLIWKKELKENLFWIGVCIFKNQVMAMSEIGYRAWYDLNSGSKKHEECLNDSFSKMPLIKNNQMFSLSDTGNLLIEQ